MPSRAIPKPKAMERNNRRALGDIGNLIIRGVYAKPHQVNQANRPVTRVFGKQLIANGVACGKIEGNIKKKKSPIADEAAVLVPERKVINNKKVVAVKPRPEAVLIEICPDAEEVNKEKHATQESSGMDIDGGLGEETKKGQILDIDAGDVGNELAAAKYVNDLYRFYRMAEGSIQIHDYMDSQDQLNENMRMILVDWLVEVHHTFKLSPETLYLTIQIIDRYLSTQLVQRKELQLLGISSMLIASKYEEIWAPQVYDMVDISDRAYSREHVLGMEKAILAKLGWSLTGATPYVFLVRFVKAAMADKEMESMVFFLAELGLMQYSMVKFCPSMFAASAVYAARCILNKTTLWDETLKLHTGYSESQLIDCAKQLIGFHSGCAEHKLNVVYRKYLAPERCSVALLGPAKML